jgi:hypothetical protein
MQIQLIDEVVELYKYFHIWQKIDHIQAPQHVLP